MKIRKIILATMLATSVAYADQEPLEITIPLYSLYPSGMSLQSMNVDTVYPDSDSNSTVVGDVLDIHRDKHSQLGPTASVAINAS